MAGVALPQRAAGYLMKKELDFLGDAVNNPKRPFVAIIGGAKVSGKIDVIESLLPKVDTLIIGGGMAFTFYKAQGKEIGGSLVEDGPRRDGEGAPREGRAPRSCCPSTPS